jgi:hypothetical protein
MKCRFNHIDLRVVMLNDHEEKKEEKTACSCGG